MKILAIGAHPDDVSLFCGGSLLRAINEGHEVRIAVCTAGENRGTHRIEEEEKAIKFMGAKRVYYLGFIDGELTHGKKEIAALDKIVEDYKPDIVLSHSDRDHHQDHKAVFNCVKSVNRNWSFSWITYESYDVREDFIANLFVDISKFYEKKLELLKIFDSQQDRWYFKKDVIEARSLGSHAGKYVERFRVEYLAL